MKNMLKKLKSFLNLYKRKDNKILTIENIVKKGCSVCGCENKFLIGPRGGLSRMFMCDNCKTKFVAYPTGKIEIIK